LGRFFVISEEQAQKFADTYFECLDVLSLKISGKLSPKILVVSPDMRLSWQYHYPRSEIWRVISGQAGIKKSFNDEEGTLEILNIGNKVILQQGEHHRLICLDDFAAHRCQYTLR
jgi:mannose-6-phosphate isomerase